MFSVCFHSRLLVSLSPRDQTLRFHGTLATLGFQQPLHPVNRFYCFQETFENFLPLPPFSGTTTAGAVPWLQSARKIPTLQDLEASRQDSCDHYASWNHMWLHRNLRNFMKKGIINHCIYQFQSLSIAIPESHELGIIPKKERWKQRSAFQPLHIAAFHSAPPWYHHTTQKPHLVLHPVAFITPSHRGAPRCQTAGVLSGGMKMVMMVMEFQHREAPLPASLSLKSQVLKSKNYADATVKSCSSIDNLEMQLGIFLRWEILETSILMRLSPLTPLFKSMEISGSCRSFSLLGLTELPHPSDAECRETDKVEILHLRK